MLQALGWWALQFTPRVCVMEGAVLMELQGSVRLLGGESACLAAVHAGADAWCAAWPGTHVHLSTAPTALAALALRRQASPWPAHCTPQALAAMLDRCPLAGLQAAQPHSLILQQLGCRTLGQLRRLPRGGVSRRFGAALLDALDQAYGRKTETYSWISVPEQFWQRVAFTGRIDVAQGLMFGVRRLLLQLNAWLCARQCGVTGLVLHWEHDLQRRSEAPAGSHTVRTAQATRNVQHLERLLAEHLARLVLHAPVVAISLEALGVEPLCLGSASLLPEDQQQGEPLHQFIERISARLGADKVTMAHTVADHRPHHMQQWHAASLGRSQSRATPAYAPQASHPPWLLHEPLALPVRDGQPVYQGRLQLLAGPERIEAGWWGQGDAAPDLTLRDYFIAHSQQAGLLWIFQQREPDGLARWYLHGTYG